VLAVRRRGLAVPGGPPAIRGRLRTMGSRLVAQLRERLESSGGPRVKAVEVLAHVFHLPVVLLGGSVAFLSYAVPFLGDVVALPGLVVALRGHLGPHHGRRVAVEDALRSLGARELMGSLYVRIARGVAGQIAIRGGLVALRGTLVGVSLGLVLIGGALVGVRGALVRIRRGLISGAGRLIGVLPSSVPTPAHMRFLFSALPPRLIVPPGYSDDAVQDDQDG
jgi:hypothetical protein